MKKARILYVEDDERLGFGTRVNLLLQGYEIPHCMEGHSALKAVRNRNFDLCIVDVMLPGIDGFSIAEEIRRFDQHTPIIFITAKSLKEDKLKGLKLGGDDYITKPFSIEELILKIEIFLRRRNISSATPSTVYKIGDYEFDYPNLSLRQNGDENTLTQREADLLKLFIENPNKVLKRSDILKELWGEDDYFLGRSLDVFISRLRKYLKNDNSLKIENIHGVGFRLKM